jgi:hypothetical protein
MHLQYLAKNQSTQRCQSLITQGSDHPPVLEPHMVLTVRPMEESVRPVTPIGTVDIDGQTDDPETPPDFSSLVPMVCDDKSALVHAPKDDEELVYYSSSPERMNLDINVIHMSMDSYVLSEEDIAHLVFGPKEAIVVWTSLGPLPRWVPGPTTRWAPGTTRLALHGT